MTAPSREEILEQIRVVVGAEHPVRWGDGRTAIPDYEGADWTIDVFDVPAGMTFPLGRRIGPYCRALRREHGIDLTVLTHTPEATDEYFPWAREAEAAQATASEVTIGFWGARVRPAPPPTARQPLHGIQQ